MSKSDQIKARLQDANIRHWAGDNISEYVNDHNKEQLIDEAAEAFELVLDRLLSKKKRLMSSSRTCRHGSPVVAGDECAREGATPAR